MSENLGYVWEKLMAAVHGMASSGSSIQQRIANAFTGSLVRLEVEDFPEDLRPKFAEIHSAMTRVESEDDGAFQASASAMTTEEAESIARTIVDLYDQVCARYTVFRSP